MKWAAFGLRVIVGAVFVYAGVVKVVAPAEFASDIARYQIVGEEFSAVIGRYLPWLEILCGLGMASGTLTRGSAALLGLMNTTFAIAIVSVLTRGISVSCGCGIGDSSEVGGLHVLANLAMLGVSVAIVTCECDALRADRKLFSESACCGGLFGSKSGA